MKQWVVVATMVCVCMSQTILAQEKVYLSKDVDKRVVPIEKPDAEYTAEACKKGVIGLVLLQVVLTSKGKVEGIEVLNGLPEGLTESAIKAAGKFRFQPAMKDNQPVSVRMKLEYNFFSEGAPPHCGKR